MNKTDLVLNIALGAGFAPLLIAFFASLIPDIREKMIGARQIVTIFVAFCTLVFSVTTLVQFNTLLDLIMILIMTAAIVLAFMQRLGYLQADVPKYSARSFKSGHASFFDKVFGISGREGRVAVFAGFILLGIPLMIGFEAPNWVLATCPAWFLGLFWVLEEVRIFKN